MSGGSRLNWLPPSEVRSTKWFRPGKLAASPTGAETCLPATIGIVSVGSTPGLWGDLAGVWSAQVLMFISANSGALVFMPLTLETNWLVPRFVSDLAVFVGVVNFAA